MLTSHRALILATFVLALGVLAGCSGETKAKKTGGSSSEAASAQPIAASIDITIENVGDASSGAGAPVPVGMKCTKSIPATCRTTITCPAAEDDTKGREQCDVLAMVDPKVFEPVPKNQACTAIYGGPEVATITGTIDGEKIDAKMSRSDGCGIARWDEVAVLWGQGATNDGGGAPPTICDTDDPDTAVSSDGECTPAPPTPDSPPGSSGSSSPSPESHSDPVGSVGK
jgi:hypothetical protein